MNNPIYHRQECDTAKSWQAFQDYLKLSVHARSVPALLYRYQDRVRVESGLSKVNSVPSLSLATLTRWCAEGRWIERAKAYDAAQEAMLNAARAEAQQARIDTQVQAEQDQIELFRTTSLNIGRSMNDFAQAVLGLIATVPQGLDGASLTDKDLDRLYRAATIFKTIGSTVSVGGEMWATALGVNEAIAILNQRAE